MRRLSLPGGPRLWLLLAWPSVFALLVLAVWDAPLPQILGVLGKLGLAQIVTLVLINLGILLLMAVRWGLLLRYLGWNVSLLALLRYRLAGFGISYFTPGPQFGGEPVQVHLLHKGQQMPVTDAVSSVFMDRLVDLLANFTLLAIGVAVVMFSGVLNGSAWSAASLAPAGLVFFPLGHLLALGNGQRPFTWVLERLAQRANPTSLIGRVYQIVAQSEKQLSVLCKERPGVIAGLLVMSALIWLVMLFEFWLTLWFLGIAANPVETISAITAARVAILAPLPGGLGALEVSQSLSGRLLGWGASTGIALALVIRGRDVFLALLGLLLGGYSYRAYLFGSKKGEE
jgi:glycosyltransferase 2 family protein